MHEMDTVLTSILNPLRHLKSRLRRSIGSILLRLAAKKPTPKIIEKMRTALRIQLSTDEILEISQAVKRIPSANMLVYGTGHDSAYWHFLNTAGYTLFLEDDLNWVRLAKKVVPHLNIEYITYNTARRNWKKLLSQTDVLKTGILECVRNSRWDVILVDGPRGYEDSDPGRMKSIFQASVLAEKGTELFIHDCSREVERAYCDRFMGRFLLVSEIGRLRHYKKVN